MRLKLNYSRNNNSFTTFKLDLLYSKMISLLLRVSNNRRSTNELIKLISLEKCKALINRKMTRPFEGHQNRIFDIFAPTVWHAMRANINLKFHRTAIEKTMGKLRYALLPLCLKCSQKS